MINNDRPERMAQWWNDLPENLRQEALALESPTTTPSEGLAASLTRANLFPVLSGFPDESTGAVPFHMPGDVWKFLEDKRSGEAP